MPLFVDDVRASVPEVIKMLTHKEVTPGKDGKPNDFKVKNEIVGAFGDKSKVFRFTVLASDVKPDLDNPRKVYQLPNSKSFEAFYNFTDHLGETHTLRYAIANARLDKFKKLVYEPEFLEINATGTMEVRNNTELALFMHYHSLNAESGNNVPGGIKMFQTFIGQRRSAKNVEKEKLVFRVKQLFLDYDHKISDEDIKSLAQTFISKKFPNNFYNLEEMSTDEIIEEHLRLAEVDPFRMWNMYLSMENKYRKMIKEYRDAKVLIFQPHDLTWRMPVDNGGDEVLTTVPLKHDAIEWIINFLIDDTRRTQTKLDNLLEKKKQPTPQKVTEKTV